MLGEDDRAVDDTPRFVVRQPRQRGTGIKRGLGRRVNRKYLEVIMCLAQDLLDAAHSRSHSGAPGQVAQIEQHQTNGPGRRSIVNVCYKPALSPLSPEQAVTFQFFQAFLDGGGADVELAGQFSFRADHLARLPLPGGYPSANITNDVQIRHYRLPRPPWRRVPNS